MEVQGFRSDERVECPDDGLAVAIRFGSLAGAQRLWARLEPESADSLWRAAERYRGGEQAALGGWLAEQRSEASERLQAQIRGAETR